MELQALEDLVADLARGMKSKPRKIEVFGGDGGNRSTIVHIIIGREQIHRVDRRRDTSLKRPAKGAPELYSRR